MAACGGSETGSSSASCDEAVDHSDLEWIQENVFTPSCASFNACHKGDALSAGGINLEAGMTESELVNKTSVTFPAETFVVPGDPDNSYLMVLLGSREGPIDPMIGTMPFKNPLLCEEKRDAVERWISSLGQ